jgi:hypothetical protein
MHNKQIEEALFPKDKIIAELQQEVNAANDDASRLRKMAYENQTYANRYKELRSIGVLVVEEGSDPKYLKGEDMDAFFAGIGIYRGATPITDALAKSMQQTKNVMAAHILKEVYDTGSESQSKRDENT